MKGQIIKKTEGVWLIRFQRRTSNGKRKSYSEIVKGTKRQAQQKLTEKLREKDLGILGDAAKQTLSEYLDMWLETIAKPRLHSRTFGDYHDLMRLYVREPLGKIKLTDLKAVHIQKLYSEMQNRGLSPRRIRYTHSVLSSALKQAVKFDMIMRNVATLVQLPKQTRKEMDVLTKEECSLFLNASKDERLAAMFSFALATGMRPEEYLALQWKDIDLDNKRAIIRRALIIHRKGGGWHFDSPKTKQSSRSIPLPASIVKELYAHRKRQLEERLKLGKAWQDFDLVFASEIGTPLNPSRVTRVFKRVLKKAEIRSSIRLYDLRHSCATLLLQAGINPKVVSERLGHATITLTLDVYSHVLPDMQEAAAEKLERILFA